MKEIHPELPADQVLDCLASLMPAGPNDAPLTWEQLEAALRELAGRFETGQKELPLTGQQKGPGHVAGALHNVL